MGTFLSILLGLLPTLLPMILGKNKTTSTDLQPTQKQTTTTTQPATGYQSPILGLLDPMMANMLSQNTKRYSNFGWPQGGGLDTSWIDQFLQLLGPQWKKLLSGYQGGSGPFTQQ